MFRMLVVVVFVQRISPAVPFQLELGEPNEAVIYARQFFIFIMISSWEGRRSALKTVKSALNVQCIAHLD